MHILDVALVVHGNCYLKIMCDFGHSWITEQPIFVRGPLCRETEIVFFTIFFAFVLHAHKAEECNMTAYFARQESVHMLYKLHCCAT